MSGGPLRAILQILDEMPERSAATRFVTLLHPEYFTSLAARSDIKALAVLNSRLDRIEDIDVFIKQFLLATVLFLEVYKVHPTADLAFLENPTSDVLDKLDDAKKRELIEHANSTYVQLRVLAKQVEATIDPTLDELAASEASEGAFDKLPTGVNPLFMFTQAKEISRSTTTRESLDQAEELCIKASQAGVFKATLSLAMNYVGLGASAEVDLKLAAVDVKEASQYLQLAKQQGSVPARTLYNIGVSWAKNLREGDDTRPVVDTLVEAGKKGCTEAYAVLGECYQRDVPSNGVPLFSVTPNLTKAIQFFECGAALGNLDCIAAVGRTYLHGLGRSADGAKAFEYFSKGAEQGHPRCVNGLGLCYLYGIGVSADKSKALEHFNRAAEMGSSHAYLNLANQHYLKQSPLTEEDIDKVTECYWKMTQMGNLYGFYLLAELYASGKYVQIDVWKAAYYLQQLPSEYLNQIEDASNVVHARDEADWAFGVITNMLSDSKVDLPALYQGCVERKVTDVSMQAYTALCVVLGLGTAVDYDRARKILTEDCQKFGPNMVRTVAPIVKGILAICEAERAGNNNEAKQVREQALNTDEPFEMIAGAICCMRGYGGVPDTTTAEKLLTRAITLSNEELSRNGFPKVVARSVAKLYLARCYVASSRLGDAEQVLSNQAHALGRYEYGLLLDKTGKSGFAAARAAADCGLQDACLYVALHLLEHTKTAEAVKEAASYYARATAQGRVDPSMMVQYALKLAAAASDNATHSQAERILLEAASAGYGPAYFHLGVAYLQDIPAYGKPGLKVPKDEVKSFQMFVKGDALNDSDCSCALGRAYTYAYGTAKNDSKAFEYYMRSAIAGNVRGINGVGTCYENGQGVAKNHEQARSWYQKAADKGHAIGQYNMGRVLMYGYGGPKDEAKATEYWKLSADQNYANAAFQVGKYLATEVPIDVPAARRYLKQALDQGLGGAAELLNKLPK